MFELIGLIAVGVAAGAGYVKSRQFVGRRLRFVDAARKPSTPVIAGVGATIVAAPVVAVLPIVGAGAAVVFGTAVGFGTRAGAKDIEAELY